VKFFGTEVPLFQRGDFAFGLSDRSKMSQPKNVRGNVLFILSRASSPDLFRPSTSGFAAKKVVDGCDNNVTIRA
jgi:hypothetical protein